MSETSQGPGWWQASDGRWYPPEPQAGTSTLPPPPTDEGAEASARERRRYAAVILAGAAAVAIGCFLPWVKVSAPLIGTITKSGMEGDGISDGIFFLGLAALGAGHGWRLLRGPSSVGRWTLAAVALALVGLTVVEVQDIAGRLDDLREESEMIVASFGAGLWLIGLGSAAVAVAWFLVPWREAKDG